MKKIFLTSLIMVSAVTLTACGKEHYGAEQVSSSISSAVTQTATNHSTQAASSSTPAQPTASSKVATSAWNDQKAAQLRTFMDRWAPTMHQAYLPISRTTFPEFLPENNTVNGATTTMQWSADGTGASSYNVVAMYNYNKRVDTQVAQIGEFHITYAFAYHQGEPVVLVSQATNGGMFWQTTQNQDVSRNFASIARGQGVIFK